MTDEEILRNAMDPICGSPHQVREGDGYRVPGGMIQIPDGYLVNLAAARIAVAHAERECQDWYDRTVARLREGGM